MADNFASRKTRAGASAEPRPGDTQADVIEITQVRSAIGSQQSQRRTLRALGLRRIRQTVSHANRPEIRGMLAQVAHLIEVRRPDDAEPASASDSKEQT